MIPTREQIADIAAKQDEKEKKAWADRKEAATKTPEDAAEIIQRNYRGYRERRQLKGVGLDASTRWSEVSNILCLRYAYSEFKLI